MRCRRCLKKMRLKPDGWKRCAKCGTSAMGMTLRVRMLTEDCGIPLQIEAIVAAFNAPRLRVVWRAAQ